MDLTKFQTGPTDDLVPVLGFDEHDRPVEAASAGCVARVMRRPDGELVHQVRRCQDGLHRGRFYDPAGLFVRPGDLQATVPGMGKSLYAFSPVSEEAFRQYRAYLDTRSLSHLHLAERS